MEYVAYVLLAAFGVVLALTAVALCRINNPDPYDEGEWVSGSGDQADSEH